MNKVLLLGGSTVTNYHYAHYDIYKKFSVDHEFLATKFVDIYTKSQPNALSLLDKLKFQNPNHSVSDTFSSTQKLILLQSSTIYKANLIIQPYIPFTDAWYGWPADRN